MQDLKDKKILLGVCGGIAAYKSAHIVRALTEAGAEVRVLMTKHAKEFITPLTLQALSGNEVRHDLFDAQAERAMSHIELARWADCFLIAPATANMIAKMAQGFADDLLSSVYLAADIPVVCCPAMNKNMWAHPATSANVACLKARGVLFLGPEAGEQACGEYGFGRLAAEEHIVNAVRLRGLKRILEGQKLVITAGPTREALDPVRYLSNRSSGKMGFALAQAAVMAGAEVTLVAGPVHLSPPPGLNYIAVESAEQMYETVMTELKEGMIFIASAAVSDFRFEAQSIEKIKKTSGQLQTLSLTQNPDILAEAGEKVTLALKVGFAAETHQVEAYAQKKLKEKKLDIIFANQVGQSKGFDKDSNEVIAFGKNWMKKLPEAHKQVLAAKMIEIIAANLQNNGSD